MNDQPPPPSDKKPRRRSAPRKRSATKRAAKKTEAASAAPLETGGATTTATGSVDDSRRPDVARIDVNALEAATTAATPEHADASSPDAVAAKLDPQSLVDAGDRGDAPADDSPLATTHDVASTTTAAEAETAVPAGPSASIRADTSAAEAAPSPSARSAQPAAGTPFPRQAELRPGELIRVPLSVRWRDLDAFNHVNNSKYLSYLEEARLRWMLAMPGMGMDDDVAPVVAASNLNYRRPIEWPGDIVIELFVERIGGSSLTIGHRIVDSKDGGTLYCDGNVVMVWIDRNSGRAAPLPATVRAACR